MNSLTKLHIYHTVTNILALREISCNHKEGTNLLAQEITESVCQQLDKVVILKSKEPVEFQRGDTVRFKSGGMDFTVMRILEDIEDGDISIHLTAPTSQGLINIYMPPDNIEKTRPMMFKG